MVFLFGAFAALRINLADFDLVIELLAITIFAPIFVRAFFLMRHGAQEDRDGSEPSAALDRGDRNVRLAYQAIILSGRLFPLFTFHFVTGGFVIASVALLLGHIDPGAQLSALGIIGFPYIASFLFDRASIGGVRKVIGVSLAAILGGLSGTAITVAAYIIHQQA